MPKTNANPLAPPLSAVPTRALAALNHLAE
jgi:hypothetical protein